MSYHLSFLNFFGKIVFIIYMSLSLIYVRMLVLDPFKKKHESELETEAAGMELL